MGLNLFLLEFVQEKSYETTHFTIKFATMKGKPDYINFNQGREWFFTNIHLSSTMFSPDFDCHPLFPNAPAKRSAIRTYLVLSFVFVDCPILTRLRKLSKIRILIAIFKVCRKIYRMSEFKMF